MSIINVSCVDSVLNFTDMPVVSSGSVNADKIKFTFDSQWNGYTKICVFYRQKGEYYYGLIGSGNEVTIPAGLIKEKCRITFAVSGYNGTSVKTSDAISYEIVEGAYTSVSGDEYTYINFEELLNGFTGKEDKSNKVTSIGVNSTDTEYPSAKCVYALKQDINNRVAMLNMFPSSQSVAGLWYNNGVSVFIYTGNTNENGTKGHIYKITESNGSYSVADITPASSGDSADISGKEDKSNKVTNIDENSTDTQYPSAKCVYDVAWVLNSDIETNRSTIENLSGFLFNEMTYDGTNIKDKDGTVLNFNQIRQINNLGAKYGKILYTVNGSLRIYKCSIVSDNLLLFSSKDTSKIYYISVSKSGTATVISTSETSIGGGDVSGKEDKSNKVTDLDENSTDTQYPSAKCVYDIIGNIESLLGALL